MNAIPTGATTADGSTPLCPVSGTTDQRGVPRPQAGAYDIGSVERKPKDCLASTIGVGSATTWARRRVRAHAPVASRRRPSRMYVEGPRDSTLRFTRSGNCFGRETWSSSVATYLNPEAAISRTQSSQREFRATWVAVRLFRRGLNAKQVQMRPAITVPLSHSRNVRAPAPRRHARSLFVWAVLGGR